MIGQDFSRLDAGLAAEVSCDERALCDGDYSSTAQGHIGVLPAQAYSANGQGSQNPRCLA